MLVALGRWAVVIGTYAALCWFLGGLVFTIVLLWSFDEVLLEQQIRWLALVVGPPLWVMVLTRVFANQWGAYRPGDVRW